MSTPRLCMADNCENIATRKSIPHPWWFTCESHLSLCIVAGFAPFKPIEPEGVAAPLEPSDIETFKLNGATSREWAYLHRTRRDGTSGNLGKLLRDFAEAYAAAVSKKAERERDAAVVTLRAMCGDNWQMMGRNFAESLEKIESREARILELGREIAALRAGEKGGAN